MHSQIESRPSEWHERIDVPLRMQRLIGAVFGSMALSCALVLGCILVVLITQVKRGHSVTVLYFVAAIVLLLVACLFFGRIALRLIRQRENQTGRASGRSLLPGRYLVVASLFLILAVLLAEHFLTGATLYVALGMLFSGIGPLILGVRREQLMHNQLPDPTSPSVTPPAKTGGAPFVAADH